MKKYRYFVIVSTVIIYSSLNAQWVQSNEGLTNTNVLVLANSDTNLFAGTLNGGIFRSTNNGANWSEESSGLPTNAYVYNIAISDTNIFAGIDGSGVFLSTNKGANWTITGLTDPEVLTLLASGTDLFAGTSGGVWRRPLSEMITSVENKSNDIPSKFILEQNHPNPFNPSTSIQYAISSNQFVQLKVYDVIGNEVATLVNEEKPAGNYEVSFNASRLSSGIYFYKLQAGSFVETKKMILIK